MARRTINLPSQALGPVQEVQVGGQDVADVVRGVLGPQVLA